jgi:hypothetical protein
MATASVIPAVSAASTQPISSLLFTATQAANSHAWIHMLTVAESYFESDDFRGDVILRAAFPHPLLKRLIRFERGPDSLMRTDDRADALSRYFEPRVYQRNRAHLSLPGPVIQPPARSGRGGKRREWALPTARRRRL